MKAIKAIYNGIDKFNDFLGRIFSVRLGDKLPLFAGKKP